MPNSFRQNFPGNSFGGPTAAAETRAQTQYWLNYNLASFSTFARTRFDDASRVYGAWSSPPFSEEIYDRVFAQNGYPGVITAEYSDAAAFINRIANKGSGQFLDLTPAQQAVLVPHFELYLGGNTGDGETPDGQAAYIRLPLTAPMQNSQLTAITQQGYGRPAEVAFKSFEWEDQGNAPGTTGMMFAAKMQLYFSSIGALGSRWVTADGSASFLDVISPSSENRTVGIVAGWAVPPDTIDTIDGYAELTEAVERQRAAFDLHITGYDLTFTENGGVELSVEYILSENAMMFGNQMDLMVPNEAAGWGPNERATALQREIDASTELLQELGNFAESVQTAIDIWRTVYNRIVQGWNLDDSSNNYYTGWGLEFETTGGSVYTATLSADGQITERTGYNEDGEHTYVYDPAHGTGRATDASWSEFNGWSDSYDYLDTGGGAIRELELNDYGKQYQVEYYFQYYAQREVPRRINNAMTDAEKRELREALDGMIANGSHNASSEALLGTSQTNGQYPMVYSGSGAVFRAPHLYAPGNGPSYFSDSEASAAGYGTIASPYLYSALGLPIEALLWLQEKFTGEFDPEDDHSSWEDENIALLQEELEFRRSQKSLADLQDTFTNIYEKLYRMAAVYRVDVPIDSITGMALSPLEELDIVQFVASGQGTGAGATGGHFSAGYDWNGADENFERSMQAAEDRITASETELTMHEVVADLQMERLNATAYTATANGEARVCFFYLGDLISIIYGIFSNTVKTIVGPFMYGRSGDLPQSVCLADIPINYDSFSEACINLMRESWARGGSLPPGRFLDYILEELVVNWGGMVTEMSPPHNAASDQANTRAGNTGSSVEIVQRMLYMERESDDGELIAPYHLGQRINLATEQILPPFENPFDREKYYCIYAANSPIQMHAENPSEAFDATRSVHWLKYGYASGIVKNIEFSRMDVPYMAEGEAVAQLEAREADNAGASQQEVGSQPLTYMFQASVVMVGNTLFDNGQMVYITPKLPGMVDGNNEALNAFLGLTGYYRVIRTASVIEDGKYETTIDLVFARAADQVESSHTDTTVGTIEVEF